MNPSPLFSRAWPALGAPLWLALLAGPATATPASAEATAAATSATPAPWNAQAPVPPLQVPRPFARYRSAGETAVADWPEANRTVQRIGGWRAYAREAAAPEAPAPAASTPQAVPPPR